MDSLEIVYGALSNHAADRLAALTARGAEAPACAIHLVADEEIRLTGSYGLPAAGERLQRMPTANTVTALVLRHGAPIVIGDITGDRRVPADAPIRTVGLQSYAGFPIVDPTGSVVGVCAAMDYQPRRWTPEQLSTVKDGADACNAFVAEHRARADADAQRQFLDALLNSLETGVAACDANGRIVVVNRSLQPLLGGADPSLVGPEDWTEAFGIHQLDGNAFPAGDLPLARALAGEDVWGVELMLSVPGEGPRRFLVNAHPIVDDAGRRQGGVAAVHDVTDTRRAEHFRSCELAVSTALADAESVEQAGPAVLEAIATTLGWPSAELWLVDPVTESLTPACTYRTAERYAIPVPDRLGLGQGLAGRAWQEGKPIWQPVELLRTIEAYGLRSAVAIPITSGTAVRGVLTLFANRVEHPKDSLLVLLSGICAHIGQYLERRRAEEAQLALAQSKQDYLAMVGHELRSPLTSINSCAEMMSETAPQTTLGELFPLVDVIYRNGSRLRRLVDALLDLCALDATDSLTATAVDLAAITGAAIDEAQPEARRKGIMITSDLPGRLPATGDAERLTQLVSILLHNAITYTPGGGQIDVRLVAGDTSIQLDVCDTGPGIAPEDRDHIFDRFYRGANARDGAIPGAGLGLTIAGLIAELHHGHLHLADHQAGQGTTFTLQLPVGAPG